MVFTLLGKNRIRDLFDADIHHGELGTGSTAALASDTDLVSATTGTSLLVTTQTADKQVVVDYNLPSTTAQGSTLSEFGIFNSSDLLFARFVFSSLTHSSNDQWQFSTRFFIE